LVSPTINPGDNTGLTNPKITTKVPTLIESVVEGFPFPTVHPIIGKPNYESIATLHQQLNANAASVPSHLGNGALSLLYLTVSPAVYANLPAAPFVPPANPGPTPIIPDGAQDPQIANIRTEFVEATELFRHYTKPTKHSNSCLSALSTKCASAASKPSTLAI
jgi:hypothetical protein